MPRAVGAAVEAAHHLERLVQPNHQAVGASRRPWLQRPELFQRSALQRLEKGLRRAERRRNPVLGRAFAHHIDAIAAFAQHQFNQLASRGENAEPISVAVGCGSEPRRIAGQAVENHFRGGVRAQPNELAPPAFGDNHIAVGLNADAVRVGQPIRQAHR